MSKTLFGILLLVSCLHLLSATSEYRVVNGSTNATTITFRLAYQGKDEYIGKPTSPICKNLVFTFRMLAYNDFTFKIVDQDKKRFEVPQYGIFPIDPFANFSFPIANSGIVFSSTQNPFDFKITRKINGAVLFSTYDMNIQFSEYYLEIGTQIDSQYVYGIGERFENSFKKGNGKWTVFNRDRGVNIDKGKGLQTYGYYPFYLLRERNNFFHVNYLRNSNAMDIIKSQVLGRHFVNYITIGGVLDFRFFLGQESAELTIEKINFYNGRSEIPPFWSFGFHQCRWGYNNVTELENVLKGYSQNNIPLDTIWTDIDYMINYEDFTIDQSRFPLDRMKGITDTVHYIPIIDAGIKVGGAADTEGLNRGVFIKDADGNSLVGKVWPGATHFVDFFHPNATQFWGEMLDKLYSKVKFSGIWLDMNEIANFCDGPCDQPKTKGFDYTNDLPYIPGADGIETHTIPLNSTHYGNLKEADVHAFSAMLETYATNTYLKSKNMKPFIITRGSTMGSNKFGFHWTGDNGVSFEFLKGSIADNFNNQLWGFQMVGADICGFAGNTTEELCSRWFQLGSLYPFARDHTEINSVPQQPYALGPIVLQAAKTNLRLRYSMLKYYYASFLNKKGLGTVFKPLFFVFPIDKNVYIDEICDTQFMIGAEIMAAPIIVAGTTERTVYFPQTNWYCLHTGTLYNIGSQIIKDVGLTSKVPLFIREGTGVMLQNTEKVTNTKQLQNRFVSVNAFRFDQRRSNTTYSIYESVSAMLSIQDYNDETKIDLCYRQGCQYVFTMVLTVTENTRTLEINVRYGGGAKLNQALYLDTVTVYYGNVSVTNDLVNSVEIVGNMQVTIPINDNQGHHQLIADK